MRNAIRLLCGVVMLVVLPMTGLTKGDDAAIARGKGENALNEHDYDLAISCFSEATRLDPKDAWAYTGRAIAYLGKNTSAKELAANMAHGARGKFRVDNVDHDQEISDFTEAIRLAPNNAIAYEGRGGAFASKGEWDKAIADFSSAISIEPNSAVHYRHRGMAYRGKNDLDKAINDLTKAISLDRNDARAWCARGGIYVEKEKSKGGPDAAKAVADCTEAIRLNPRDAHAYSGRAAAYWANGEYEKAILDADKAISLDQNCAYAYLIRGVSKSEKGESGFSADYDKAREIEP